LKWKKRKIGEKVEHYLKKEGKRNFKKETRGGRSGGFLRKEKGLVGSSWTRRKNREMVPRLA